MRVAVFAAVVAAHVIVFLLFPSLWRRVSQGREEEPATMPISLTPWVKEPVAPQAEPQMRQTRQTPQTPRTPRTQRHHRPGSASGKSADQPSSIDQQPTQPAPDWHAAATESAQLSAQHIVAAEDTAKRQANALTAHLKPLAPDRIRGPRFGWDPAAIHRLTPLPQGGFVYSLNDHCQVMILPMPFFGCRVGKIEANGDLFKFMHPPVKFGDWDKRQDDP